MLVGWMRWLLVGVLLGGISPTGLLHAADPEGPPQNCFTCNKALSGRIWRHPSGWICDECKNFPNRCWSCGLPCRDAFIQTEDGRFICKLEARAAVLNKEHARRIFDETRKSVVNLTRGGMVLKQAEVSVDLFNIDYWSKEEKNPLHKMGLALTRQIGDNFNHNVLLLSGQTHTNLAAVCAHEYTHLWINENMPGDRQIELQTMEAICELVAYKVAEVNGHPEVMDSIMRNSYTQGRINTAVDACDKVGLYSVLRWVREGKSPTLNLTELGAINRTPGALKKSTPSRMTPRVVKPLPKPSELKLKGVIGTTALINDTMIDPGQTRKIKLADRVVEVKCLKVETSYIEISVDGGEPEKLVIK